MTLQNKTTEKRRVILDQDLERFYSQLRGKYNKRLQHLNPLRTLAMCMLMEQTGMRIGEVCALKPEHIKSVDGYRLDFELPYAPRYTKVGARTVPFIAYTIDGEPTPAWDVLKRWVAFKKRKGIQSEFLFCTMDGSQCRQDTIGRYITREAEEAGVPYRVTPHMFRHTAATRYARKYGNPQLVQKLLGHTNIRTTEVYFHINEDDVADMLSHAENGKRSGTSFTKEEQKLLTSDFCPPLVTIHDPLWGDED